MKIMLTALLVLLTSPASAADDVLIGGPDAEFGGYGAAVLKVGSMNGQSAWFAGMRGGWIINRSIAVGGGFYGLAADIQAPGETRAAFNRNNLELDLSWGGLECEYILRPERLLHVSVSTLLGAGTVAVRDESASNERDDFDRTDEVFVLEPALNATLNVTAWLRVSAGLSYRAVTDLSISGVEASDLGGATGTVTVRFGKF